MNHADLEKAVEDLIAEMMAEHIEKLKVDVYAQVRKYSGRVRAGAGETQEEVNIACNFITKAYLSAIMSNACTVYTIVAGDNHRETLDVIERLRLGVIAIAEFERNGIKPSSSPWGQSH